MSTERFLPLHDYELRLRLPRAEEGTEGPLVLELVCRRCGLPLTGWTAPPGLDTILRAVRDHEDAAHPLVRAHR